MLCDVLHLKGGWVGLGGGLSMVFGGHVLCGVPSFKWGLGGLSVVYLEGMCCVVYLHLNGGLGDCQV